MAMKNSSIVNLSYKPLEFLMQNQYKIKRDGLWIICIFTKYTLFQNSLLFTEKVSVDVSVALATKWKSLRDPNEGHIPYIQNGCCKVYYYLR